MIEQAKEIINKFAYDELKKCMDENISTFITEKSLAFANFIIAALRDHKKLLNDNSFSVHNDIVISAALMVDCFTVDFVEENWIDIFAPRFNYQPLLEEYGVRKDVASTLFDLLESRFGEDTPVPRCKPQPNHPTDFFATAFYYFNLQYGK